MANIKANNSKETMFSLILEWQNSSISKKQFCEQTKVGYHTFNYWHKRFRSENENIKPGFTEYKIIDQKVQPNIRLTFPNGVIVELPSGASPNMIHYLINNWQ
jgi:hypothetical protein